MSTQRDYYEILGVAKGSAEKEIKAAYRKLALQYHPDRNKAADAEAKFKEINEAYQVLSDAKKRQAYDQFGHAAFQQGAGGMGGNPFGGFQSGPFTWTYTSRGGAGAGGQDPFANMDFGDPFDIFEQFFGGGFSRAGGFKARPRYGLNISFMEAVKGTSKTVAIEGKKQTIKIPAGVNDGTRIKFDDFDVTIDVQPDALFKRDGYDLFIDQVISFSLAALGGKTQVPIVDGKLKMLVRAGTQSHTLIRLRGEGVPHLRGRGKGDLYVRLIVKVPEKLSRLQKKALEEFAKVEE